MKVEVDRGNKLNFRRFDIKITLEDFDEAESLYKATCTSILLEKLKNALDGELKRYA